MCFKTHNEYQHSCGTYSEAVCALMQGELRRGFLSALVVLVNMQYNLYP